MLAYSASGLGGKKTARGPLFVNTVSITEIFANGFHYFSNKKAVCFLLDRKGLRLRTDGELLLRLPCELVEAGSFQMYLLHSCFGCNLTVFP